MKTQWFVKIQMVEGSLVHSENVYEYGSESDAREAIFQACDTAEQTAGILEINGEATQ